MRTSMACPRSRTCACCTSLFSSPRPSCPCHPRCCYLQVTAVIATTCDVRTSCFSARRISLVAAPTHERPLPHIPYLTPLRLPQGRRVCVTSRRCCTSSCSWWAKCIRPYGYQGSPPLMNDIQDLTVALIGAISGDVHATIRQRVRQLLNVYQSATRNMWLPIWKHTLWNSNTSVFLSIYCGTISVE